MKVRYTPQARDDLEAVLDHIDRQSPQGARAVKGAIRRTIALIGEFPSGGAAMEDMPVRTLPVGRFPYRVYWTVLADEVWIVHIRHMARRPLSDDKPDT